MANVNYLIDVEKVQLNNTERRQNPENRLSECWSEKHSPHQQSSDAVFASRVGKDCIRTYSTAVSRSPVLLLLVCLTVFRNDENQVSGKQATDSTPKQWNAAKTPQQEPDIPARFFSLEEKDAGQVSGGPDC